MKLKIAVVVLLVAAACVAGIQARYGRAGASEKSSVSATSSSSSSGTETTAATETAGGGREEIRQSYKLTPGAEVEVRGINGSVEVNTIEGDTAEVHVVRKADNPGELERSKIVIEQTPTSLIVYNKKNEGSGGGKWWKFWDDGNVRHEVVLNLPRRVELTTKGVNGAVKIGEIEGAVRLNGINGRVELAQAQGFAEVSGVNGGVTVGVTKLGEKGLSVSGVNGGIKIRVGADVNADVRIKGHNGGTSLDLPNMTEQEKTRSTLTARIGTGGAPISISGVNGGIKFEAATAAAQKE